MLFENNKYSKWYYLIIDNAKNRTVIPSYVEKHHIIPKSIGGLNGKENLVVLTAREHFICHLLLTKMLTGDKKRKMIYAFWQLSNQKNLMQQQRYRPNSKIYEIAKKMFSEHHSENMKLNHPLKNKDNKLKHQIGVDRRGPTAVKGAKRSESMKEKMRNRVWTEKAIQSRLDNCRKNAAARKGKPWSDKKRKTTLNTYLEKNLDLALKIIALHDSGLNNLQISKQLNITWDKVKYSLLHRTDFETYKLTQ
jgi:hypothetical protein